MESITNWCVVTLGPALAQITLWAQQKAAPAAKEPPLPLWPLFIIFGVMLYLIVIRPDSRRRREHDRLMQGLKQNDRVVTIGGIYGTVVTASKDSESVVIRVDESNNTRLRVLRSAISRVESEEKAKPDSEK